MFYVILVLQIFLVLLTLALMRTEKNKHNDSELKGKLFWQVFVLTFLNPIFSQAIFYYGWKNKLPKKAKKANQLGWFTFLILILISILKNFL